MTNINREHHASGDPHRRPFPIYSNQFCFFFFFLLVLSCLGFLFPSFIHCAQGKSFIFHYFLGENSFLFPRPNPLWTESSDDSAELLIFFVQFKKNSKKKKNFSSSCEQGSRKKFGPKILHFFFIIYPTIHLVWPGNATICLFLTPKPSPLKGLRVHFFAPDFGFFSEKSQIFSASPSFAKHISLLTVLCADTRYKFFPAIFIDQILAKEEIESTEGCLQSVFFLLLLLFRLVFVLHYFIQTHTAKKNAIFAERPNASKRGIFF